MLLKLRFIGQLVENVILSEAGKIKEFPREVEESVPFSGEYGLRLAKSRALRGCSLAQRLRALAFDSPSTSLRVAQDDSPKQRDKLKHEA